jgi:hypothetical protein
MEMEDFGRREGFLMQMQMIVGRSFDFVARLCGSEALKADRLLAGKLKDTYERYGALERYENLLDQQKIQKPFRSKRSRKPFGSKRRYENLLDP